MGPNPSPYPNVGFLPFQGRWDGPWFSFVMFGLNSVFEFQIPNPIFGLGVLLTFVKNIDMFSYIIFVTENQIRNKNSFIYKCNYVDKKNGVCFSKDKFMV